MRITLRDHMAPVRQHGDGSSARMSGDPGAAVVVQIGAICVRPSAG